METPSSTDVLPPIVNSEVIKKENISFDMDCATQPAEYHPRYNEDSWYFDPQKGIAAVYDGVSEGGGGKFASSICREIIKKQLQSISPENDLDTVYRTLTKAFSEAQKAVLKHQTKDQEIASTGSVLAFHIDEDGKHQAIIKNCGDSRVYLFRNGVLKRLTQDHNNLYHVVDYQTTERDQDFFDNISDIEQLSEDQKKIFNQRNQICNYFGIANRFRPDTFFSDVIDGDIFLLTTDGVHDNLTTDEITRILSQHYNSSPSSMARALLHHSLLRSRDPKHDRHKPDDMTSIIVKVKTDQGKTKTSFNKELFKPIIK